MGDALSFQSISLMLRGRAGLTQRELAAAIGTSERSIQNWEAGAGYPSAASLQRLIAEYLARGGFNVGNEHVEAAALWNSALAGAHRLKAPFDTNWFSALLARSDSLAGRTRLAASPTSATRDWGEAPAVNAFYGRGLEQAILLNWLLEDHCRLVGLCGMGGIGKTTLAARLSQVAARQFDLVFWRSLRNAPPCDEWLAEAILFLSEQRCTPASGEAARRRQLLDLARERRCLLVLDNLETILEPGAADLRYRPEYAGFGDLLQMMGEAPHRSCLLVTSREEPSELVRLAGPEAPVRVLRLGGVGRSAGQALLIDKGLAGTNDSLHQLVEQCNANPLALQLIGELVATLFGGDINEFLSQGGAVCADIRSVLQAQFERLSPAEREMLFWLAVEREPVSVKTLVANLGSGASRVAALDALHALSRRSLLEVTDSESALTLQPVVLEHATESLIDTATQEIVTGQPSVLVRHPLVNAQCKEYVRRAQERLIARPLLDQLAGAGLEQSIDRLLVDLLDYWRDTPESNQGFGPGNIVTLLRVHHGHLRGLDLSRLVLRQVDLSVVEAQDVSLVDSSLQRVCVAQQFGAALSAQLSANADHLAIGTLAGEVRVWRLSDYHPVLLDQAYASVWGIGISGDARLIASCGSSDAVYVWDSTGSSGPRLLHGRAHAYWCIAVSGDGRRLASGSADGNVCVWDTTSKDDAPYVIGCNPGGVRAVALSHDGEWMATRGATGHIAVWDVITGNRLVDLGRLTCEVGGVALSADGCLVAAGDVSGVTYLWDASTGMRRAALRGHTGTVWAVALSADASVLATGGEDRTVRLWSTRTGECVRVLHEHPAGVSMVSLSADGQVVSSVCVDGSVHVWDTTRGHRLVASRGNVSAVFDVAFNHDGSRAATGSGDGTVRLWDMRTGRCIRALRGHVGAVWGVACSADGSVLMSGSLDRTVRIWDVATGTCREVLSGHTQAVTSVDLSPDQRTLASTGIDGTVRLSDILTGDSRVLRQPHLPGLRYVHFAANGRYLLTGGLDGTAHVWDASTGECLKMMTGESGPILAVAMSADGGSIAWAEPGGVIRVCDAYGGDHVRTLGHGTSALRALALSPDGTNLVAGGIDGTVQAWDVATATLRASLQAHTAEVWSVTVSSDGRLAASAGLDGTARVWDLEAGMTELHTLRPDRPYERMDISGIRGVSDEQRQALLALGAVVIRDAA